MASSWLQEMLDLMYAPNAVIPMLSGKAIAQAVCAHLVVGAALQCPDAEKCAQYSLAIPT